MQATTPSGYNALKTQFLYSRLENPTGEPNPDSDKPSLKSKETFRQLNNEVKYNFISNNQHLWKRSVSLTWW